MRLKSNDKLLKVNVPFKIFLNLYMNPVNNSLEYMNAALSHLPANTVRPDLHKYYLFPYLMGKALLPA
jgi:hypothetical protein